MDLFHDLGSVKYVKSRDSTELTEKKKRIYTVPPPSKHRVCLNSFLEF